ncbi:7,8-dihydropterin-6-yl-methyl-4-(beta-D-ribofuranosyl)aminobenzene 5'-phosphate synthase [Methanolinea mesophila]|uniref:MBL fold metallo-hydrolase n=1 Tax=Methanolinea mesophila TaxID=547055 RepID=UPI001AE1E88A|nr:MBL fold metallo-hydrolase [Methanolinea mesophila]MBP1928904.1 7,8-dihydropterin-6-yl-methyl-4-(beta-D-ribofuranosyl)aminobenzene 5'-phosphate synthase [Methanolinea mesophila]
MSRKTLRQADRVEITVITDNYTDLLMQEESLNVRRFKAPRPLAPLAEHGLSCLVKVRKGSEEHCLLMDTGISPTCFLHNTDLLGVDCDAIEEVVLSHGHWDHFGGLPGLLSRVGREIPVTVHPDAFFERRINLPLPERPSFLPRMDEEEFVRMGAVFRKSRVPELHASGLVLCTGEVERTTPFEGSVSWTEMKVDGTWTPDTFPDDQSLVINVKNKGLVVLSGCAHAGIVNTVMHAIRLMGTDRVHAVLGGFHLSGPLFDPVIPPTIEALQQIGPHFVVPMHCTGWKAITRIAKEMPGQFVLNTVGTTYVF